MQLFRTPDQRVWQIGDWTLDERCHRLVRGEEVYLLNPKEMGVLRHLTEAAPDLVPSEELFNRTWPDVVVGDHVLHEVIRRLRKALGDIARQPKYIETIAKRGYRAIAPVARVEPTTTQADQARSVVVLPFDNASGDSEKNYMGDFLAEEIRNRIGEQPTLRVIAMTSARAVRERGLDVDQLAHMLSVRYVVEGSFSCLADAARVSVRLIDTRHGGDVWSERFDRELVRIGGVHGLCDDISARVALAVGVAMGADAPALPWREWSVSKAQQGSVIAYNLVEQAMYSLRRCEYEQTGVLIDQALDADPRCVRALAQKSALLIIQTERRAIRPATVGYAKARRNVERMLQLDSNHAPAYVLLGCLRMNMELDFRLAMEAFETAESLKVPLQFLAGCKSQILFQGGRFDEALSLIEAAAIDDPLFLANRVKAIAVLDAQGREDEAQNLAEELMRLAPNDAQWVYVAAEHAANMGDPARARELMRRADRDWSPLIEYVEMCEGNPARFRDWFGRAARDPRSDPLQLAAHAWRLRNHDEHLRFLNAAMDERLRLGTLPQFFRSRPDYWHLLNDWALADPSSVRERLDRVTALRARAQEITERMVL